MARVLISLTILLSLATYAFAQQNARELFERARLLDESNQNLSEAIKLYKQVVSQAKDQRALAARAQFQVGMLYARLGRKEEALRAFKVVVGQYPDQPEVWQRAQAKITAASASQKSPAEMVVKQSGPSPDGRYLATFTFSVKPNTMLSRPVIDPVRHRLYVTTSRVGQPSSEGHQEQPRRPHAYWPSTLVVINTETNSIVETRSYSVFLPNIAFNPANNMLYATAQINGHVKVIDVDTFTETQIPVPGYPTDINVNPAPNKIYVTSQGFDGNDKLFVIDGATNVVTGPFDLNGVAGEVVVNSATNRIYALTEAPTKTRVFNGADHSVLTDLPGTYVVAADPVHNRLYAGVASGGGTALQVLDGNTHSLIATFSLSGWVLGGVDVNPDINRLYVALTGKKQVAIIDTATNIELGRLFVADKPSHLTVDRTTGCAYVCHGGNPNSLGVLAKGALDEGPEEFFDSFDSPTLDPAWTALNVPGGYSLTEHPGHLRCRVAVLPGATARYLLIRPFRGDVWTLEMKVAYFTGTSGGMRVLDFSIGFGAALGAGTGASENGVYIRRSREDWNGCCPGELGSTFVENGVSTQTNALTPNSADSYIWRMTRNGRTVTVERSDDGTNFTLVGTHTFGAQVDGLIQYLSISFNTHANKDAYADYDYVKLSKEPPDQAPTNH